MPRLWPGLARGAATMSSMWPGVAHGAATTSSVWPGVAHGSTITRSMWPRRGRGGRPSPCHGVGVEDARGEPQKRGM
eukprot:12699321-Alexandrium_andersonii.AAC.1